MNKRKDRKKKRLRKQAQKRRFLQAVQNSDSTMDLVPNEIGSAKKRNVAKNTYNTFD